MSSSKGFVRLKWALLSLVILVGVAVIAGREARDVMRWRELAATDSDFNASLSGKYLAARLTEISGEHEKSARFFESALTQDPKNEFLIQESMRANLLAGDVDRTMVLADRQHLLRNDAVIPTLLLTIGAVKKENYNEALEYLKLMGADKVTGGNNVRDLALAVIDAWALLGKGDEAAAMKRLENLKISGKFVEFITYQQALMSEAMGKDEEAARYYRVVVRNPNVLSERLAEAANRYFTRTGNAAESETLRKDYHAKYPDYRFSSSSEKMVRDAKDGIAELLTESGALLLSQHENELAIYALRLALYLRSDLDFATVALGTVLEEEELYAEAEKVFRKLDTNSAHYDKAQVAIARNLAAQERRSEAKSFLQQVTTKNPANIEAWLSLGELLMKDKNFQDAVNVYDRLLTQSEQAETQKFWMVYFARGIALERLNEWDRAEPDFMKALELEPNHPEVLNYLAYSWLVRKQNMKDALEMLMIAVEKRPNDAHIIDSYGWALYMLGEYEEALLQIERANELMPYDPTVNDHLGDVYWKLGRTREARFQWKRSLQFNPEEEDRQQIEAKLEHGLNAPDAKPTSQNAKTSAEHATAEKPFNSQETIRDATPEIPPTHPGQ